ncbi:MAG: sulfatase-like hydrolase/transferase [Anaerolineae bacterium]
MNRPNVILLTIDTLRADRLGCYGCERPLTPNLDRLAAQGVRFTEAITGGSWTQAAFPVMMTSTYASMYGGCLGALTAERPSPIQLLQDSGYATGGFSSSPLLSQAYAYNRGFQHFADLTPQETDPALRSMKGGQRLLRTPITHAISRMLGQQTRPARIYVNAEEITNAAQE